MNPGDLIRRELDARGWTQKQLAVIMKRPVPALSEIVCGRKRITPETALELAAVFKNTSAMLWLFLDAEYRLSLVIASKKLPKLRVPSVPPRPRRGRPRGS